MFGDKRHEEQTNLDFHKIFNRLKYFSQLLFSI